MNDKDSGEYANHLVILHISDLHARQDDDYTDRLNHIRSNIPDGSLDAVVVTGDLTDHGKDMGQTANSLVVALKFIDSLRPLLKPGCEENVFTVPGNHDAVWFEPERRRDDRCQAMTFTINLDSREVSMSEAPRRMSDDSLMDRIRSGALRQGDEGINRRRFTLHENVTSMLSRHPVVVDGIHRLVRAVGMNVILLNTEFLYAPGATHEPDFYPGNIQDIIDELKDSKYWGVPTIAIGHRPDMNIYSSARFKQYLRDCRVVMYMSGHKHDTSVSLDDGVLDFTTWRFSLSSGRDDSGIDTGYSLIEWFGDRVNATFISLKSGKKRREQTVVSTVYRPHSVMKYWEFYRCDICQLIDKIRNSDGAIVSLVGGKGAGKTTILRNTEVELSVQYDTVFIDIAGMDADQVITSMIHEMPNRRIPDSGVDDLVDRLVNYSRRTVFFLDNLITKTSGSEAVEDTLKVLRDVTSRCPNVVIVVSGLEPPPGTMVVTVTKNDPSKLVSFFADIFREKSGRPLDKSERGAVKRWLVDSEYEVGPEIVIAVASICSVDPSIIEALEAGGVRPEALIMRPGILDNSEMELLFLLFNAVQVRASTLEQIGAKKQLDRLEFFNACQVSNVYVRLNWDVSYFVFNGCPADLLVAYIRTVIRNDLADEYGSVLALLESLLDKYQDPYYSQVLWDIADDIREFVKKARQNIDGMCELLERLLAIGITDDNKDDGIKDSSTSRSEKPMSLVSRAVISIECANLLYRKGELSEALKKYEELQDFSYRAKLGVASVFLRTGKVDEAIVLIQEVRDRADVDSRMLYARSIKLLGDAHFLKNDIQEAERMYRRAIEMYEIGKNRYLWETYVYACRGLIDMMVIRSNVERDDLARFIASIRNPRTIGFASSVHIAVQHPRDSLYVQGYEETEPMKSLHQADTSLSKGDFADAKEVFLSMSSDYSLDERIRNFANHGVADCLLNTNMLIKAKAKYKEVCMYYSRHGPPNVGVAVSDDPKFYMRDDIRVWVMAELGYGDALRRIGEFEAAGIHYLRACMLMKRIPKKSNP